MECLLLFLNNKPNVTYYRVVLDDICSLLFMLSLLKLVRNSAFLCYRMLHNLMNKYFHYCDEEILWSAAELTDVDRIST